MSISSSTNTSTNTNKQVRLTSRVDIFSLGCVIHFALTTSHPFGDRMIRELNILQNKPVHLRSLKNSDRVAHHLVASMLFPEPTLRPSAPEVLLHPFFWDHAKRLRFLMDVSDFLEFLNVDHDTVKLAEKGSAGVVSSYRPVCFACSSWRLSSNLTFRR